MRHSNRRPWTVLLCLAVVVPIAAAPSAEAAPSRVQSLAPHSPDASGPILLRDGVIVDADRGVAYLMNREGRVDALRTADGALLWSSAEAAKPLLALGDLLIAQAEPTGPGSLPLVTLDRGTGEAVAQASVELPAGLWARLSDGPRTSFRVAAAPHDGRVALAWEARRAGKGADFQGYVPAPSEGQAPDAAPATLAERRRVERISGSALLEPRAGTVAVREKGTVASVAGPGLATFDGLAEVPGRKFLSADGRHVLASRRAEGNGVLDRYHWAIYTRDGALVGETSSAISAAPFVVAGAVALVEARPYAVPGDDGMVGAPLRLRAVDLTSGLEAWAQPIRQVEFAGPFPP